MFARVEGKARDLAFRWVVSSQYQLSNGCTGNTLVLLLMGKISWWQTMKNQFFQPVLKKKKRYSVLYKNLLDINSPIAQIDSTLPTAQETELSKNCTPSIKKIAKIFSRIM